MSPHAYICDAVRTPFGRYGGALSSVRADDLGAVPLRALMQRAKTASAIVLVGAPTSKGVSEVHVPVPFGPAASRMTSRTEMLCVKPSSRDMPP